ncbi:MAG: hypothetical protein IJ859_00475, partial [Synergistaceae bacterium]|nr:hypothetical protein [Synergistaceae bacterium]
MDNLKVAKEMTAEKVPAKIIRMATGWELDKTDKKWRWEIMDGEFNWRRVYKKINQDKNNSALEATFNLDLIFKNKELFKAYPDLAGVDVDFKEVEGDLLGYYDPDKNRIAINIYRNPEQIQSTLIHEIQHAIQHIEGFATGGNNAMFEGNTISLKKLENELEELKKRLENEESEIERDNLQNQIEELENRISEVKENALDGKVEVDGELYDDAFDAYRHLAGEAESRNAQKREKMSADERRKTKLTETLDTDKPLIERYNKAGIEENIQRGSEAMDKVISEKTDVMNAMHRDDVGDISFLYGTPGTGEKLKHGWGISHLIARRNQQGYNGEDIARKMVEVIAKGYTIPVKNFETAKRVEVHYKDYTAVLSLYKNNGRQTWLLTGWKNYKQLPGATSEVYDSTGATLSESTRFQSEEGAGNLEKSLASKSDNVKEKYNQLISEKEALELDKQENSEIRAKTLALAKEEHKQGTYSSAKAAFLGWHLKDNEWFYEEKSTKSGTKTVSEKQQEQKINPLLEAKQLYIPLYDVINNNQVKTDYENIKNKYKNTDKYLRAPNGKATNLDEKTWIIVRTPAFKQWFGDWENNPSKASKVLDKNGEPLVVYHGTTTPGFSIFFTHGRGDSAFFSSSKNIAETYSNGNPDEIYPVFLNIRKPYRYNAKGALWKELNFDGTATTNDITEAILRKKIKGEHDGVIFKNIIDSGNEYQEISTVYAVPNANQIKSATKNKGTFYTHDDEIYNQAGYNPKKAIAEWFKNTKDRIKNLFTSSVESKQTTQTTQNSSDLEFRHSKEGERRYVEASRGVRPPSFKERVNNVGRKIAECFKGNFSNLNALIHLSAKEE